ncbi:MAG TPA: gamma-glutamyl-gamma-aminobutyrate hydrolase family protein [Chloroflexota bacterium]|nr:gamma-glutamyl-gamma-aminobutyrate hydrolase family protein [Chloroflexota bacterium]
MRKPLIGLTSFTSWTMPNTATGTASARSTVNQAYVGAIVAAGGAPVILPIGLDLDGLHQIYRLLDGLLLPGGVDVAPRHYGQEPHPQLGEVDEGRDDLELAVLAWALADDLPILGICRGIQVLAVAAGGTLYQDIPSQLPGASRHEVREFGAHYMAHEIDISPTSRLAAILGVTRTGVNTFHHQSVCAAPPGFIVSALSADGVVEAIEAPARRFTIGVQCHPEGLWNTTVPEFARLFAAFVEAAANRSLAQAG